MTVVETRKKLLYREVIRIFRSKTIILFYALLAQATFCLDPDLGFLEPDLVVETRPRYREMPSAAKRRSLSNKNNTRLKREIPVLETIT